MRDVGRVNNVDLRDGVNVGGEEEIVVAATNRTTECAPDRRARTAPGDRHGPANQDRRKPVSPLRTGRLGVRAHRDDRLPDPARPRLSGGRQSARH